MNEAETRRFHRLIEARLAALAEDDVLGQEGQKTVMLDQQAVGRLSRMDALQSQAMAQATQARRDTESRRLLAALARIDEGEFGWCTECGEAIAPRRLELDPAAALCIGCARG